jgi:hypothetical protein
MPRSRRHRRRHRRRRYRVSRSYLHLNRGLTSPLATAMNFIPISYFWSPLCCARGMPRALAINHPRLPRLYATSGLYSELLRHLAWKSEEQKCPTSLRPFLSSRAHEFPSPFPASLTASPPLPLRPSPFVANKNSANAPGAVKYVRDARLDAGIFS